MEYHLEDEETSSSSTPVQRQRTLQKNALSALKFVFSAIALPILVSITVSFYVNTHLLRPRITARYAQGHVLVLPIKDLPNAVVVVLLDFSSGFAAPIPSTNFVPGSQHLDFSGGEIVAAKRLTFQSPHDFVIDNSNKSSQITKVLVSNNGYVTANHVRLGIQFPEGAVNRRVVGSPNIKLSQETVPSSGINSTFLKLEIDRLGARENAFITVASDSPKEDVHSQAESPYLSLREPIGRETLLYVNSDEGPGSIGEGVSWKQMSEWEKTRFPEDVIGFWAYGIQPLKAARPKIEDVKGLEMPIEVDSDGKSIGTVTLKYREQ